MAGIHNNYLTELVIKQKGNRVEGVFGYYFRDKYQSFVIHGRYNPETREVTILNIPVIFYGSNSTVNSVDCITNFRGILMNSRSGSYVKGTFYHDERYKYTCPDIKVSYALDKSDNQHDSTPTANASARIWKPQADDFVVEVAPAAAPVAQQAPAPRSDSPKTAVAGFPAVSHNDTLKTLAVAGPADVPVTPAPPPPDVNPDKIDSSRIAASITARKNILNRELEVESDSIRLSFYDNGDIDGDSISIFVNNQVVLTHKELAAKAFNIFLRLDSTRTINEVGMFAENLGRIPPNTALMVITDGKNRYEVFLSSSLTENATIRLRRKKK
jgi:hypothetical protein